MSMDVSSRDEREEERARQRRVAEELKASGALEGIFGVRGVSRTGGVFLPVSR